MGRALTHTVTEDGTTEIGTWTGGEGSLGAEGDFGGGTLTIKSQKPGGSNKRDWGTNGQLTDDGVINFKIPANHKLFAVMAGSTTPSVAIDVEFAEPQGASGRPLG